MFESKNSIYVGRLYSLYTVLGQAVWTQLTLLNFSLCGSVFLTMTRELKMASHRLSRRMNKRNLKNYQEGKYYLPGTPQSSILAGPTSTVWASPPMPSCLGWEVTSRESTSWKLPWRCLNLLSPVVLWSTESWLPVYVTVPGRRGAGTFHALGGSHRARPLQRHYPLCFYNLPLRGEGSVANGATSGSWGRWRNFLWLPVTASVKLLFAS